MHTKTKSKRFFNFFSLISDGLDIHQINLQINEELRLKEDKARTQRLLFTVKKPHCLFLAIIMVNVAIYIHLKMLCADIIIVVFFLFSLKKEHLLEWEYTASVAHRNKCLHLQSNRFSSYDCTVPVVFVTDAHYYGTLW